MNRYDNIALVGFMGCGKSTIAAKLSEITCCEAIDTDLLVENLEQVPISEIFSSKGESYFRSLETKVLNKILGRKNLIVATGGGIVEREENWPLLKGIGKVIFLDAGWDTLQERIAQGEGRPLGGDGKDWAPVKQLWERRLPLYRKADIVIKTDGLSVEDVCRLIMQQVEI